MRLLSCEVINFGSYDKLTIDFTNSGLSLIYGPTGAGKSTVPDIASWCLFGLTAKNGSVDEVRSWQSPNDPTTGVLEIELPDGNITVTRVRGKANENDLYWTEAHSPDKKERGKDLTETQRSLEKRLSVSAELYLTGAYFSEFSHTGTFFMAKAKDRRAVFESIADLDFAVTLGEKTTEAKKTVKKELTVSSTVHQHLTGRRDQLQKSFESSVQKRLACDANTHSTMETLLQKQKTFEVEKTTKIAALQTKYDRYETDTRKRVDDLIEKLESLQNQIIPQEGILSQIADIKAKCDKTNFKKCPTCGGLDGSEELKSLGVILTDLEDRRLKNERRMEKFEEGKLTLEELESQENPYTSMLEDTKNLRNHYGEQLEQEKAKVNPFIELVEQATKDLNLTDEQLGTLSTKINSLEERQTYLTRLYELSFDLRGELLKQVVNQVQLDTNGYLSGYFDSEMRVEFALDGSDDLLVNIQKNGYPCVYRQLSKGQRQLLKLCFVVSVMKAASNRAGVHFSQLWFDEALDGLDEALKIKAFDLFSELQKSHESIFLIDHAPAFQNLFSKRYHVTMDSDISTITVENE